MFSDIRNIIPIKAPASDSQAQQSDVRQEILHHDPDQERQKKKKHSKEQASELFGDDLAEVSVDTLDVFLEHILAQYTGTENSDHVDIPITDQKTDDSVGAQSEKLNPNAQAVGAYARTATYTEQETKNRHISIPSEMGEELDLSPADIQLIYKLQKDILRLKEKQVASIRMYQVHENDSFLQMLENGVKQKL